MPEIKILTRVYAQSGAIGVNVEDGRIAINGATVKVGPGLWENLPAAGSGFVYTQTPDGDPAATDDSTQGWSVGDHWGNSGRLWICTNAAVGAAQWRRLV